MRALLLVGACLLVLIHVAESLGDHQERKRFIRVMERATGETGRLEDVRKQLLALARPVPAEFRGLEDANNDQEANDDAVADEGGDDQVNYGYDSYLNADGLDLSGYSLKYVGCQAVNTWSDNMAADEDSSSVFALEKFVILRMCSSKWCSGYRKFGCSGRNYGEYMILMEDYLAIMKQYHYSRFSTFCTTCKECMYSNQNVAYQQANDDDAANDDQANDDAANDDAVNDDAANDDAANDDAANDDQVNDDAANNDDAAGDDNANQDDAVGDDYNVNQYGNDDYSKQNGGGYDDNGTYNNECQFQEECSGYEEICRTHQYNADYESFMECTQVQVDNSVVYLGPHCGSDRHTITIGVFEDQYCSIYLGDVGSYDAVQGYDIDENSMSFYFPTTCIACSDEV